MQEVKSVLVNIDNHLANIYKELGGVLQGMSTLTKNLSLESNQTDKGNSQDVADKIEPTYALEDVRARLFAVKEKHGSKEVRGILDRLGAKNLTGLDKSLYEEIMKITEEMM